MISACGALVDQNGTATRPPAPPTLEAEHMLLDNTYAFGTTDADLDRLMLQARVIGRPPDVTDA
jgi:hypothetical protein